MPIIPLYDGETYYCAKHIKGGKNINGIGHRVKFRDAKLNSNNRPTCNIHLGVPLRSIPHNPRARQRFKRLKRLQ